MDGTIYQDYLEKQINQDNACIISFNLNTDGDSLLNGQNLSLWPILGTIVELKSTVREKFDNIVVFGLWLSESKPDHKKYLQKSLKQLIDLQNHKIEINGNF